MMLDRREAIQTIGLASASIFVPWNDLKTQLKADNDSDVLDGCTISVYGKRKERDARHLLNIESVARSQTNIIFKCSQFDIDHTGVYQGVIFRAGSIQLFAKFNEGGIPVVNGDCLTVTYTLTSQSAPEVENLIRRAFRENVNVKCSCGNSKIDVTHCKYCGEP